MSVILGSEKYLYFNRYFGLDFAEKLCIPNIDKVVITNSPSAAIMYDNESMKGLFVRTLDWGVNCQNSSLSF
jgi:hypothetical protein